MASATDQSAASRSSSSASAIAAPISAPSATMLSFESLGKEMVTIYVGPERKGFFIHKKLLCESAQFFKGAFTRGFEEAHKGEIVMLEDSPGAFSLYVNWIYRSTLPTGNTEEHLHNLYDLYIFAEKLCLVELKDKTMDSIQDMAKKYDLGDELITVDLVSKVLLNTRSKWEGLRRFLIRHMLFVYTSRYLDDNEEDLPSENEYDSESSEYEFGDVVTTYVMRRDVKKVYEIAINCNDFRFLDMFIKRLIFASKAEGPRDVEDVRYRGITVGRCSFHCHGKEVDCRAVSGASDSFLRKSDMNKA
ncbi:hypothetical protein BGZ57DRAFT_954618 [Hyaloscypha finlandica]|nr:hypothetical protein BGZ57DRAFT_954618 [Hyaloscypha finlandica]